MWQVTQLSGGEVDYLCVGARFRKRALRKAKVGWRFEAQVKRDELAATENASLKAAATYARMVTKKGLAMSPAPCCYCVIGAGYLASAGGGR
jgi:hypothetical protein